MGHVVFIEVKPTQNLVGIREGRPRCLFEDNIKMNLKGIG
jgi:hypothetical protein